MAAFRAVAPLAMLLAGSAGARDLPLDLIRLPPGFAIAVYAGNVPNARAMALGDAGTLFVGSRQEGTVYAVVDEDRDGTSDRTFVVDRNLDFPTGVAFREGALYVGVMHRVLRYDGIESRLGLPPLPAVVTDRLPRARHHGWKFIDFGPDGKLYVPVGAPCNVCEPPEPFGTLLRMDPDGGNPEVFARGIRNSVGFAWHPGTRELWFTDNGRDDLGDDTPPDELNRALRPGLHFGFPHCHGGNVPEPELPAPRPCAEFTPPVQRLGPHVAALGMTFYDGTAFPAEFRNQPFIAEHGSWNRSEKIGYRVTVVRLDDAGRAVAYEPFASGWLQGEEAWGRPTDVLVLPDGSMLVADDQAGAIYRITYRGD